MELRRSRHTSKQNPSHSRAELFDYASIFHEKALCLSVLKFETGFKLQGHWINSQDLTATQSNLSCLEIYLFGEMANGSIQLGQHFNQNYFLKNQFSKESDDTIRFEMHRLIFV